MPSEIFSPDSGGSQKMSRSMEESRTMGTKMLTTLYKDFLWRRMENCKPSRRVERYIPKKRASDNNPSE